MSDMPKLRTKPPSITFNISREDYDRIYQFAYEAGMSVAEVCQLGAIHLIADSRRGVLPLLPEFWGSIQPGHA